MSRSNLASFSSALLLGCGLSLVALCACNRHSAHKHVPSAPPLMPRSMLAVYGDGRASEDTIRDVAVDAFDNVFITGGTHGGVHATAGAYDTSANGNMDVFVSKLDKTGKLLWTTYFGGPGYDRAYAIGLDPQGNVVIAGRADDGLPTSAGAFQPKFGGDDCASTLYGKQDGFVAKLSPDGARLLWASYFGNNDSSFVRDMAVDSHGDIYLADFQQVAADAQIAAGNHDGKCSQPLLPFAWKALATHDARGYHGAGAPNQTDSLIAKINRDGSQVVWLAQLGGSEQEMVTPSVVVDTQDNLHFLTFTKSKDARVKGNATHYAGDFDGYAAKLDTNGELIYARYVGGRAEETGDTHNIAADAAGNTIVAFGTVSDDMETSAGSYQPRYRDGCRWHCFAGPDGDGYIAKIAADGSRLLAATYVGGAHGDLPEGVSVDALGNIFVSGTTHGGFPVTSDAQQYEFGGVIDAMTFVLSPELNKLRYASYYGGDEADDGVASAVGKTVFAAAGSTRPTVDGRSERDCWLGLYRAELKR